jgi:type I restriction enzyme, S subunit
MELKPGYKRTEVGVIPEDWEVRRLGELVSDGPRNGYSGHGGADARGTPTLKLTATTSGQMLLNKDTVKRLDETIPPGSELFLQPGDILVQRSNTAQLVGTTAMFDGPPGVYVYPDLMMRLRFKDRLNAHWMWRYANSANGRRFFVAGAAGSTGSMPKISGPTLRHMVLPIPPPSERGAIVAVLGDVDALLGALTQLIAKKRDLKQAAMQQLLTGQSRLPDFTGKWETVRFADIADKTMRWSIAGGPFGSNLKASDYLPEGVRILQLQNIGDGRFHDDYAIYTSEAKADELLSNNIYPGEIILSKMGDPVARACFVPIVDRRYLMASDGIRLAVDPKRFDKRFVHNFINSPYFRKKAIEASTGSTRQRIGLGELKSLPFLAPFLAEQTAIADVLSDMDAELAALEQRLAKSRALKQGMMQELLTGRTRLL